MIEQMEQEQIKSEIEALELCLDDADEQLGHARARAKLFPRNADCQERVISWELRRADHAYELKGLQHFAKVTKSNHPPRTM